jgi:hypothetical protein
MGAETDADAAAERVQTAEMDAETYQFLCPTSCETMEVTTECVVH